MPAPPPRLPRLRFDTRILLAALAPGAPAVVVLLLFLWLGDHAQKTQWTLTLFVVGSWFVLAAALRDRVVRPLQTISNMLAAMREADFSIRGRGADPEDPLGLAFLEANALSAMLRNQRLGALEATMLLRRVMDEVDVAIFTFDDASRLRLVNREGERLLAAPGERLLGRSAAELGLADLLESEEPTPRSVSASFPGGGARWEVRRGEFRQDGRPHRLLMLAEVSRTLRAEERDAWKRLVRVLSHEINNSLTPVRSIAQTLRDRLRERGVADATSGDDDFRRGLDVIASRAESLGRFVASYAKLTKLPPPVLVPVDLVEWVHRVASLESRVPVKIVPGRGAVLQGDRDQLDQLLINLMRNAADASLETNGAVRVAWTVDPSRVRITIEDDGKGIANAANLFVPFFTTKEHGTGIGLALARQIAEAHGGTIALANREPHGCVATVDLPVNALPVTASSATKLHLTPMPEARRKG